MLCSRYPVVQTLFEQESKVLCIHQLHTDGSFVSPGIFCRKCWKPCHSECLQKKQELPTGFKPPAQPTAQMTGVCPPFMKVEDAHTLEPPSGSLQRPFWKTMNMRFLTTIKNKQVLKHRPMRLQSCGTRNTTHSKPEG